jgi:hypothetical protein
MDGDKMILLERYAMRRSILCLTGLGLLVMLGACSIPIGQTPATLSTQTTLPSPSPILESPTTKVSLPTVPPASTTPTTTGMFPNVSSGTYAVVLVAAGDVLNVRSMAGAEYTVSGTFAASATNVLLTGPSETVEGKRWVQVQNPAGGTGWVNGNFLTEFVTPEIFCIDSRVNNLLANLGAAVKTLDGEALAALISPQHGLAIRLWRNSTPIIFDQDHARWVFDSTYRHNWGSAPASGLDTLGSFHEAVLPVLLEVFKASNTMTCNSPGPAPQYSSDPWPLEYSNINYYAIYKPGTPGVDLDFRTLLVGVEYVRGQPTLFSLIHFNWEP